MFYLVNINDIPFDIEYRLLAENCDYWNGLSLIETRENIDNLQSAPECFPNGEPVSSVGCIVPFEKRKPIELPDLTQTAQNMAINAFNRPIETMRSLLAVAPIDNVVGLYNSDGVQRIAKVD